MISATAEDYGRFMAGYCSNLPLSSRLIYAAYKPRWQVWQLFSKLSRREVKKREEEEKERRVGITMGISCHTCHAFSVFGLGMRFRAMATCHLTCHELAGLDAVLNRPYPQRFAYSRREKWEHLRTILKNPWEAARPPYRPPHLRMSPAKPVGGAAMRRAW